MINVWRKIFRLFGYPKEIKTDNGPPFHSYLVRQFMLKNSIKHRKITPLWPRANAICERFMRNRKVDKSNWREELDIFLGQYRATPHDSTGITPAQLLLKTQSICENNAIKGRRRDEYLEVNTNVAIKKVKSRIQQI